MLFCEMMVGLSLRKILHRSWSGIIVLRKHIFTKLCNVKNYATHILNELSPTIEHDNPVKMFSKKTINNKI